MKRVTLHVTNNGNVKANKNTTRILKTCLRMRNILYAYDRVRSHRTRANKDNSMSGRGVG